MRKFLRDYSLTLAFLLQFVVSLVLYWYFLNLHTVHPDVVLYEYMSGIFENLQSESFQVGALIWLAAHLYHRGSPQSKDNSEKTQTALERIEAKLHELEQR